MASASQRSSGIKNAVKAVAALAVIALAWMSTEVRSTDAVLASAEGALDPAAYATERYSAEIAPQIAEEAEPLPELLTALDEGAEEAEYGHSAGSSSAFSFPVTVTGTAGEAKGSILPLTVEGVSPEITVQIQIGPALNGTAIRDATGTISFNDFANQLEFQEVATELNNQVRETVLTEVTPSSLSGKTITATGAFTRTNPALVSIVPTSFEIAP